MPNIRFGNIDFSGDGAYVWGAGEYSAPSRSVDMIEVPGRNGDLLVDNGNYNNTTAQFGVIVTKDIPQNTDKLKHLLYSQKGYQRLYDSDLMGFYRMAAFNSGFDLAEIDSGVVHIEFDCKPFKYDILGDNAVVFVDEGNIYNKYFEPSRPIITIYGSGEGYVQVGSKHIAVFDIDEYVTIDTEMQDAFKGEENKNNTINTADASLEVGENSVSFGGGVTKVEIVPRWVTI